MSETKHGHCHEHEQVREHEHEQVHEHEHEHMHLHEHHREHKHAQETDHDHSLDPAIFSETYELLLIKESGTHPLQEALVHWIEGILEWTKSNHGFVGHVKVFIEGTENLWLSSTGKAINMKSSSRWSEAILIKVTICATAIIFGTTQAIFDGYASQFFQDCVEKECPLLTLVKK